MKEQGHGSTSLKIMRSHIIGGVAICCSFVVLNSQMDSLDNVIIGNVGNRAECGRVPLVMPSFNKAKMWAVQALTGQQGWWMAWWDTIWLHIPFFGYQFLNMPSWGEKGVVR